MYDYKHNQLCGVFRKNVLEGKRTRSQLDLSDKCECPPGACGLADVPCQNIATKVQCDASIMISLMVVYVGNCNGSDCKNRLFREPADGTCSCAESKPTLNCGNGLFATVEIAQGAFVAEYVGKRVSHQTRIKQMYRKFAKNEECNFYHFSLDENWSLDGECDENHARFINHSCNPNCVFEIWKVGLKFRVGVFAKAPIAVGDQLTVDYGCDIRNMGIKQCKCGAKNCKYMC